MEKGNQLVVIGNDDAGHSASIASFNGGTNPYHTRAKRGISEITTTKVVDNKPFKGMQIPKFDSVVTDEGLNELSESFVNTHFFNLAELGITVSMDAKIDENREDQILTNLMTKYKGQALGGQADSLRAEYISLRSVQNIFRFVKNAKTEDKFEHQHLMLLSSVNEVINSLSINDRSFILKSMADVCAWNGLRGRYRTPMALHKKYLPELFLACPVWFVYGKGVTDNQSEPDPRVDDSVKFFCDLIGTKRFAWLYQMYNRRTRTFDKFSGPDLLSPHLAEAIPQLAQTFDYLVIATPYHNTASKEWADPTWQSNIDPYLIGFKKGFDHMVIIERWSGTGLFPLMSDMMADTIDHLRAHIELLKFFKSNTYWYKGEGESSLYGDLIPFGREVLDKFEEGKLFEYLRTE
jgi:hypothetical protein